MSTYNRFGAVYTSVIEMYSGTVVADYGGQSVIQNEMDRVTREVASYIMPQVFTQITKTDAEQVVIYATAGQNSWTLGMIPVIANSVHLWIYPPVAAGNYQSVPGYFTGENYSRAPVKGVMEIAPTDYSLNPTTGVITYAGSQTIPLGSRIYASYDVDMDNAAFSLASLGDAVVIGTAAALGSKLYADGTDSWALVKDYQARYAQKIQMLMAGTLIPDEVRRLNYYKEVERASPQWGTVKSLRG